MNLELDKSNWEPVKFGDVVAEARATVRDPKAAGIERVVGLEHIEPECVHLRQWASIDEGTTFTKGFKKGHVLFGRRRAYLKKAALADFDGICSGDITVLEAKERLLPELLPFLVCNDAFFDYAVKHSAGGLSPRTKFKDLANYEFLLPPKDQQAKLAELLWAADAVVESYITTLKRLQMFRLSTAEALLIGKSRVDNHSANEPLKTTKGGRIPESWRFLKLKEVLDGSELGGNYANGDNEKGLPLIKMGNLGRGRIVLDKVQRMTSHQKFENSHILKKDDLLFNTRNTLELVGKVAIWNNELPDALYNSNILKIWFREHLIHSNRFMNLIFNSRWGVAQLRSRATGTTSVAAIYKPELMTFRVIVPSLVEQQKIVEKVDTIDREIEELSKHVKKSKFMTKSLINEIFSQPA